MDKFIEIIKLTLPSVAQGLIVTLELFAVTLVLSIPLGYLIALMQRSKARIPLLRWFLRWFAGGYTWLLRGTPLLLQIFFIYFGLPYIKIGTFQFPALNNMLACIIAFTLNYAAYFGEIFRAGIESIDKGQYECAKALGYTGSQTMRKIIIPQMVRLVLPPVSNETITLVKDTALVSVVALNDIMRETQLKVSALSNVSPFIVAAVFYLVLTLVLTIIFNRLEKKLCNY
ncbi:amino acid ABC transporter permease [Acetivibrio sp. MSJd-27]|uniref:amino acid ABC transporter permease n=1 Tax=Acetivibrio sp. MSJd-27 TaxID=2841523 RepID=UPI00209C99B6|nr:amino acid ABC transporter permease [Acetivibrio sp. MSJd-27]